MMKHNSLILIITCLLFFSTSFALAGPGIVYPSGSWETWRYTGNLEGLLSNRNYMHVVTERGVYTWDFSRGHWLQPFTIFQLDNDAINFEKILGFRYDDTFGTLTVTTPQGNFEYNEVWNHWSRSLRSITPLPPDSMQMLMNPISIANWNLPNGWIAQNNGNVLLPDLSTSRVVTQVETPTGDTWVYLENQGLLSGNKYRARLSHNLLGPTDNKLQTIAITPEYWYAGGRQHGLSRYVVKEQRWERVTEPTTEMNITNADVRAILPGENGEFTLATARGVFVANDLNPYHWKRYSSTEGLSSNNVYCIANSDSGIIAGTDYGFDLIGKKRAHRLWDNTICTLLVYRFVTEGDTIFGASHRGVLKISRKTLAYSFVESLDGVGASSFQAISVTPYEIWVGGSTGLAAVNRSTGQWRQWNANSYLQGAAVTSIQATDFTVWVGTTNGLYRVDRTNPEAAKSDPSLSVPAFFSRYTTEDGLPSNQIHDLQLTGDVLNIAAFGGFTRFHYMSNGRILSR